jgi:hypothetical protein
MLQFLRRLKDSTADENTIFADIINPELGYGPRPEG